MSVEVDDWSGGSGGPLERSGENVKDEDGVANIPRRVAVYIASIFSILTIYAVDVDSASG